MSLFIKNPSPPELVVPNCASPRIAFYGDQDSHIHYLPLSLVVATLPGLRLMLPTHCQFLPTTNIIFPDANNVLMEKFIQILKEGWTNVNDQECLDICGMLYYGGVSMDNMIHEEKEEIDGLEEIVVKEEDEKKVARWSQKKVMQEEIEVKKEKKKKGERSSLEKEEIVQKKVRKQILKKEELKKALKEVIRKEKIMRNMFKKKKVLQKKEENETKYQKKENICHFCKKLFRFPSTLRNHLAVSHGNGKKVMNMTNRYVDTGFGIQCLICNEIKKTRRGMTYHLGSCHNLVEELNFPNPEPALQLEVLNSPQLFHDDPLWLHDPVLPQQVWEDDPFHQILWPHDVLSQQMSPHDLHGQVHPEDLNQLVGQDHRPNQLGQQVPYTPYTNTHTPQPGMSSSPPVLDSPYTYQPGTQSTNTSIPEMATNTTKPGIISTNASQQVGHMPDQVPYTPYTNTHTHQSGMSSSRPVLATPYTYKPGTMSTNTSHQVDLMPEQVPYTPYTNTHTHQPGMSSLPVLDTYQPGTMCTNTSIPEISNNTFQPGVSSSSPTKPKMNTPQPEMSNTSEPGVNMPASGSGVAGPGEDVAERWPALAKLMEQGLIVKKFN